MCEISFISLVLLYFNSCWILVQLYADNHTEESSVDKGGGLETIKFFLNCLSLVMGRLDGKQFDTALADYGPQLLKVLLSQVTFTL